MLHILISSDQRACVFLAHAQRQPTEKKAWPDHQDSGYGEDLLGRQARKPGFENTDVRRRRPEGPRGHRSLAPIHPDPSQPGADVDVDLIVSNHALICTPIPWSFQGPHAFANLALTARPRRALGYIPVRLRRTTVCRSLNATPGVLLRPLRPPAIALSGSIAASRDVSRLMSKGLSFLPFAASYFSFRRLNHRSATRIIAQAEAGFVFCVWMLERFQLFSNRQGFQYYRAIPI